MTISREKALKRFRKSFKRERWVRCEVNVRREDAPLVRNFAAALNDPEHGAAVRALIRGRFEETPAISLKSLLTGAPLEGIDIKRSQDLGREVDLRRAI